jgi:malate synthase
VAEGLLDLLCTAAGAMHDAFGAKGNSSQGSIYIVKPKMHGCAECDFVVRQMVRCEELLKIPKNTIKMGVMDEERRTSCNLREMLRIARERVVFINTGFLDRTGDEIHTAFRHGVMLPKDEIKAKSVWFKQYETRNVQVGVATKLYQHGQIGKGMWAEPDNMASMLASKLGHLKAAANVAWVPSPTGAVLHALHYHMLSVAEGQERVAADIAANHGNTDFGIEALIQPPFLEPGRTLTADEVTTELRNNVQGLLGYVGRWVQLGIGCSKVPNLKGVGLMEDCATLRIAALAEHWGSFFCWHLASGTCVRLLVLLFAGDCQNQEAISLGGQLSKIKRQLSKS